MPQDERLVSFEIFEVPGNNICAFNLQVRFEAGPETKIFLRGKPGLSAGMADLEIGERDFRCLAVMDSHQTLAPTLAVLTPVYKESKRSIALFPTSQFHNGLHPFATGLSEIRHMALFDKQSSL
ncbi:MAG: hypothetical protein NTX50_02540 [Candidatus Sumerlaeota bacterium]|nr:hypothetical protein [Candidatus Sumerlaeota bacterium]